MRAVLGTPADADVELAWEVREGLVPEEDLSELADDGRGVQELAGREAGGRAADDVADVVHAGLQRHQVDSLEPAPDLLHLLDAEPAELYLLPGRDVERPGAELLADAGEGLHLLGDRQAVRDAHAHHELPRRLPPEEHARPLQPLAVVVGDRLPASRGQRRDFVHDLQGILLLLEPLDLVERDDELASCRAPAVAAPHRFVRRSGGRAFGEQRGFGQAEACHLDDPFDLGSAAATSRRRARLLAHGLHAS